MRDSVGQTAEPQGDDVREGAQVGHGKSRLADCMERTMREYLDIAPLVRRAAVEAFGA